MKINANRPLEELIGNNRRMVRLRLGRLHCGRSVLSLARECRNRNNDGHKTEPWRKLVPVAIRRGWAKCVIETVSEYRSTWIAVRSGNFSYECQLGAFD